jgi:hypothetical protein
MEDPALVAVGEVYGGLKDSNIPVIQKSRCKKG